MAMSGRADSRDELDALSPENPGQVYQTSQ
jgi:hypothetical protein